MSNTQTTQRTYSVSKVKQLVDLNGDATNFKVVFDVRSKDQSPFEAVIIDQENLDKNEHLDFKQAPGVLSGEILADRNAYQNYYLALRSVEPKEVDVQLQFDRLPDFIPPQESTAGSTQKEGGGLLKQGNSTIKIVLLAIVLIVAIYLYMSSSKGKGKPLMKASLLDKLKKVNIPN